MLPEIMLGWSMKEWKKFFFIFEWEHIFTFILICQVVSELWSWSLTFFLLQIINSWDFIQTAANVSILRPPSRWLLVVCVGLSTEIRRDHQPSGPGLWEQDKEVYHRAHRFMNIISIWIQLISCINLIDLHNMKWIVASRCSPLVSYFTWTSNLIFVSFVLFYLKWLLRIAHI